MKKLAFKKWISLSTVLIFMFQQISPAFAMEPLAPREKTSRAKRFEQKSSVPISERKFTASEKEKENIIQKLLSHTELSQEEEQKFKILSNELMTDLLRIKETSSEETGPLVMVIGRTGSGKTTLTEWLAGQKLWTVQDKRNKKKFNFESESGHIKDGAISKTTCPNWYPIDDDGTHCADCPGLEDTRGVLQDTKNTVYMRELFRKHTSVKFLIAEPASSFEEDSERGTQFKKVLYSLKVMFRDSYLDNHSLQDSIALVVTHYDGRTHKDLGDLQEWITGELSKDEQDEVIKGLLTSFSQPHKIAFFSQPDGPQNPFQNKKEKEQILTNLQQTLPLPISFETDIKSSFSNDSITLLKIIHNNLKMDLSIFLSNTFENELKPCLENKIIDYKQLVDSTAMACLSQDKMKCIRSYLAISSFQNFVLHPVVQKLFFDEFAVSYGDLVALGWGITAMVWLMSSLLTYEKPPYEKARWTKTKKSEGEKLSSEFNCFIAELTCTKFDICGESLLEKKGALKKFKPELNISEIEETAEPLDYLSALLAKKKSEYSEEIWTPVFQDFAQELTQYSAQSGEALYETAEELFKKKEAAHAILIEDVQKEIPHLSAEFIKTVVKNLETASPYEDVNVTGSPLSKKKLGKFIHYMDLCTHIYTDDLTREFPRKYAHSIRQKWNEIIKNKKEVARHYKDLLTIRGQCEGLLTNNLIFEKTGAKNLQSEQVPSLSREAQTPRLRENFTACTRKVNNFLQRMNRKPLEAKELGDLDVAIKELDTIQQNITSEYSWYFAANPDLTMPQFQDTDGESHQLTNKAVVAGSFFHKASLKDDNITILDVGFRNLEDLKGIFKNILKKVMTIKDNPNAWFQNWGEVDYIAYLESDPTPKEKDKLFIVYSGSNSANDWVTNITIGNTEFQNLSVHEGIGKLFKKSIPYDHQFLEDRLTNFYNYHRKPKNLDIITTGHSLGGGLASLAAYFYKAKQQNALRKITGLDEGNIRVKTFIFGSPAIVDKQSKKIMERRLGKNNIFRVWTFQDRVVNWTDNAPIQHGVHIGTSYPLYNIEDLEFNIFSQFWGAHGTDRYRCYLEALGQENPSPNHERLTSILTNYVKNPHAYETRQQEPHDK